jgi:serine/threonine protein kinase
MPKSDIIGLTSSEPHVEIHSQASWKRIEEVFLAAADLTGEARERYLDSACGDDGALRREVESLLDADKTGDAEVGVAVRETVHAIVKHEIDDLSAGAWRLVEEIGRGGMGTVYRATRSDGEFHIEVAIKILNRGIDSQAVLDRFRRERQMLARLEHPNIARLLDGGTTKAGQPYLVMEFVPGEPLTRYCDKRRLTVPERVALFRKVCDAVSCAHRNLIIHRDLKPDNILVTADGTPKLLDFGIGKILDPTPGDSELTQSAERIGTPSWCSPEQIRGENIGVGTDIYSLGVVLFRLLSGYRPYPVDNVTWENAIAVICERDPVRPSDTVADRSKTPEDLRRNADNRATTPEQLRRALAGDLDNILAYALRKEPDRRYHSVDQFSDELQRYLEGRPVRAAGDTVFYLAGKFIRRHRLGVGTAALLTILLCISTIAAVWQARRLSLRIQEDKKLAGAFLTEIHAAIEKLPGSTPARETLLTKSLEYLNGIARDAGEDRETRRSLALAEERFAKLLEDMGHSDRALAAWRIALPIREELLRENPGDRQLQFDLARSLLDGGYITGRAKSAIEMRMFHQRALAIAERLVAEAPGKGEYEDLLADACTNLAYSRDVLGEPEAGIELLRRAVQVREGLRPPPTPEGRMEAQRKLATLHYRLGSNEARNKHPREALVDLQKALEIQTGLASGADPDRKLNSDLAGTHHFMGVSLSQLGMNESAIVHFGQAIRARELALAADPKDGSTRQLLAGNYGEKAAALAAMGLASEAAAGFGHAIALMNQAVADSHGGVPVRIQLGKYLAALGGVQESAREYSDAVANWRKALAIFDALKVEGKLQAPEVIALAAETKRKQDRALELLRVVR